MLRKIAHLSVGLVPLGLGFAVLVGAMMEPSRFALGFPGLRSIGINAALCYAACGIAFLCHPFASSIIGGRALKVLGLVVAFFAAAVLFQRAFDIYPSGAPWRVLLNAQFPQWDQWQGGMSFTAAIAFLSLGIVLARLQRIRGPRHGVALLALAVVAFTLSTVGVIGQLLGMDLLFSEAPGSLLMSGPASWAMGVLAGGVIYLLVRGAWFKELFAGREDRRILFSNIVFLFVLTLAAGLISIGLFERATMRNYQNSQADAVASKAELFESQIMLAISSMSTASVISGLGQSLGKPDGPPRQAALREVSQELLRSLWRDGVRMVRLIDLDGQVRVQAGEETKLPASGVQVDFHYPMRLYWMDGWWLELQVPVFSGLRPVGKVLFQSRLIGLDIHLALARGVGEEGKAHVCVKGKDAPHCFPDVEDVGQSLENDREIALLALSGSQGVALVKGAKGAKMVAYTPIPIGYTTLGMMYEVRAHELFHSLRVQLLLALFAIVCVILAGAFAFYRRVYPMMRDIQFEKTRIQETLQHIPEGVITLDGCGVIQAANPAMERLFGYPVQQMVGERISGLIPGVCNQECGDCAVGQTGSGAVCGELTGVRRDGSHFPVELAFNRFALDGRKYLIGIVRDVTERRRGEEALRKSEEQYRTILETAMDGFFSLDGTGRLRGVNSTFCRLLRYGSPEEMLGLSISDIEASETWAETQRHMDHMRHKGEDRFESRMRRKDGRVVDVEVSVKYEAAEDLFFCFMRDITKRKRAENALRRSLASLADAQRIAHIGDWDWEISSDTLLWSEEAYRIFGMEPKELVGSAEGFLSRVHPEDKERVVAAIRASLDERRPYSVDHRIVLPDGSIRVVHELAEVVFDKKWRPIRMRGTMQDVTERKRIEEDLEHSRTLLRKLAAHIETVRESEKGHIAREIHDELGQLLTALRMDVALMRIQFGGEQPILKEKLESVTDLVDRTIRVVRSVASNLRPSALDVGIVPAIEWLVEDFQKRNGIMLHFKRFDRDLDLDERREITVFRIMQESLTNVARYANASRVEITVAKLKGQFLWVEVKDNGKGFDLDKLPPHKAFGLMGIRERSLSLGGECLIDSAPGAGTSISVHLPLETGS